LPVKPSQTVTSALPQKNVPGFHAPDERQRRGLQHLVRVARQLVAFAFFLANRQQPDPRRRQAQSHARIHRTHVGELQQVRRLALHRRAGIQQHRRARPSRHRRRHCRTVNAGQHPESRVRGDHARAGVAGTEHRHRPAGGHLLGGNPNRGARLPSQRPRRRVRHLDHVGRVNHPDIQIASIGMTFELGANRGLAPDQVDREPVNASRRDGAINGMGRRMIAAHRINGDSQAQSSLTGLTWRAR
jgi:hypothetical protein